MRIPRPEKNIETPPDAQAAPPRLIVFVCTGNTCRSPLAEVMARSQTAAALDVPVDQVLRHGLEFRSAGLHASDGAPPSASSLRLAGEAGLDLSKHRAHSITPEELQQAAKIYGLSRSHLAGLQARWPNLHTDGRLALLRPDGRDIADPFGGPIEAYQRAFAEIEAAVRERFSEWNSPTSN